MLNRDEALLAPSVGGLFFCCILIITAGACALPQATPQAVEVQAGEITYTMNPASLELRARIGSGENVIISAPAFSSESAVDLETTASGSHWALSNAGLRVLAEGRGNCLQITLSSATQTSVTWPVQPLPSASVRAIIWPRGEGAYVSLQDARGMAHLRTQTWDTLETLTMPLWGLETSTGLLSCVANTQFRNEITLSELRAPETSDPEISTGPASRLSAIHFTHEFRPGEPSICFRFKLSPEGAMPIEPALLYREWLKEEGHFHSLASKMKTAPALERLAGAPQIYLWGGGVLTRFDLRRGQGNQLAKRLAEQVSEDSPSPGKHLRRFFSASDWEAVLELAKSTDHMSYAETALTESLSRAMMQSDFYDERAWHQIELTSETRSLLSRERENLTTTETLGLNSRLLRDAYPDLLPSVEEWGGAFSRRMLDSFRAAGVDRLRIAVDGWEKLVSSGRANFAHDAIAEGYLIGPYDSYHSIHDPQTSGTDLSWPTAQFDQHLFEFGPIIRRDGSKRPGFKGRGYLLSPLAARPYMERRVRANYAGAPFNYYFLDCDGFGQLFDDWSPLHPATAMMDGAARVDRMRWISSTFHVPVGTEGGSAYAVAGAAAFEGIFAELFGWGDPDMQDKKSPYYPGGYFPSDQPAIFFKPVPAKPEYIHLHFDPRNRVPLWEAAFHDAAVSGHHWLNASLKHTNVATTVALTEILYQVPPMYHLNPEEFAKRKPGIMKHFQAFSPLHRLTATMPMTAFRYLTPDRAVQKSVFGDRIAITVNFGDQSYTAPTGTIPPGSALYEIDGQQKLYSPGTTKAGD